MGGTRELHLYILTRIHLALGGRSWSWLSRQSGVPRSTLASQAARPKFSVEVLVRVADALGKDPSFFLPEQEGGEPRSSAAEETLAQIAEIISRPRDRDAS